MLVVAGAATVVCLFAPASAVAVGDTNTSGCPHETESSPGFRGYLADCRAYELVSPPYQGGSPALWSFLRPPPISSDGQHMLGQNFAGGAGAENDEQNGFEFGSVYEFSRSASGWSTESLEPPASLSARRQFVTASSDLSRSLWKLVVQPKDGEEIPFGESQNYAFVVRESAPGGPTCLADGGQPCFRRVGPADSPEGQNELQLAGAAHDLTHLVLAITSKSNQLWPGDGTREGDKSLYEYVGTGNHEPVLVGVRNAGPLEGATHLNEGAELVSECGTVLGSAGKGTAYNALSASGATVYFTAMHTEGCSGSQPTVDEVYARLSGSQTVAVSEPAMTAQREQECSGTCHEDETGEEGKKRAAAVFQGASEDGSKVFFTSDQPLLNSDKDTTNDLYEAELTGSGLTRLIQVSKGEGPSPGVGGDVAAVARISEDGSHVYYVAKGILTTVPNGDGEEAKAGAYNLYGYDAQTGRTSFVAALMTLEEEQTLREALTKTKSAEREAEVNEIQAEAKAELKEKEAECAEHFPPGTARQTCDKEARKEAKARETARLNEVAEQIANAVAEGVTEGVQLRTRVTPQDEQRPFETTPDGRFLAFVNSRDLTGPEDTSTVGQVFEYDAHTGALARVSIGQCPAPAVECAPGERFGDNGNTTNSEDVARILSPEYAGASDPTEATSALSLAADGAVFFTSSDALTPQAAEGRRIGEGKGEETENVYEYREGNVYLISPGDEAAPLHVAGAPRLLGVDESGEDVFFSTTDSLVPQDIDTQASWYDARSGGGFPAPSQRVGCVGETCQGPLSGTPTPLAPGSSIQPPGENLPPPPANAVAKSKAKPLTRAQKLARALKACQRKPKPKRAACRRQARRRYGNAVKARKGASAKRSARGAA